MTQQEIIEMTKEASATGCADELTGDSIERFAKLVAAKEREACAKLIDIPYFGEGGKECAEAIRARGNT